jgi:hypothetical protein
MVQQGIARQAFLWDRMKLLKTVYSSIRARIVRQIRERQHAQKTSASSHADVAPLLEVPFKRAKLNYDRYRLHEIVEDAKDFGDPVGAVTAFDQGNLCVLLGGAGFGKTTVMMRALEATERVGFYFRAANLINNPVGTSDFLGQFVSLQNFFSDHPSEDWPVLVKLGRPVVSSLLTDADTPVFLVVDGLDESIFFSHRGGLQWLFNALLDVEVPVVLAARTEFWLKKLGDFETSFGIGAQVRGTRQSLRSTRLVELTPWTNAEIQTYSLRYRDALTDNASRSHIEEFLSLVDADRYNEFYGDIPRRPLYLNYILDTVAVSGIRAFGRRELLLEWSEQKIRRDVAVGEGAGRVAIVGQDEGVTATVDLSFRIMKRAAKLMSRISESDLEMLPDCFEDDLRRAVEELKAVTDFTGLVLQSLLVPLPRAIGETRMRLRFAHQVHQELFLALYIEENREAFRGISFPLAVGSLLVPSANSQSQG